MYWKHHTGKHHAGNNVIKMKRQTYFASSLKLFKGQQSPMMPFVESLADTHIDTDCAADDTADTVIEVNSLD